MGEPELRVIRIFRFVHWWHPAHIGLDLEMGQGEDIQHDDIMTQRLFQLLGPYWSTGCLFIQCMAVCNRILVTGMPYVIDYMTVGKRILVTGMPCRWIDDYVRGFWLLGCHNIEYITVSKMILVTGVPCHSIAGCRQEDSGYWGAMSLNTWLSTRGFWLLACHVIE